MLTDVSDECFLSIARASGPKQGPRPSVTRASARSRVEVLLLFFSFFFFVGGGGGGGRECSAGIRRQAPLRSAACKSRVAGVGPGSRLSPLLLFPSVCTPAYMRRTGK